MDATRRTLKLRRVAMMAALAALTIPAGQAEAAKGKAKPPVITSVSPAEFEPVVRSTIRHPAGKAPVREGRLIGLPSAGATVGAVELSVGVDSVAVA